MRNRETFIFKISLIIYGVYIFVRSMPVLAQKMKCSGRIGIVPKTFILRHIEIRSMSHFISNKDPADGDEDYRMYQYPYIFYASLIEG